MKDGWGDLGGADLLHEYLLLKARAASKACHVPIVVAEAAVLSYLGGAGGVDDAEFGDNDDIGDCWVRLGIAVTFGDKSVAIDDVGDGKERLVLGQAGNGIAQIVLVVEPEKANVVGCDLCHLDTGRGLYELLVNLSVQLGVDRRLAVLAADENEGVVEDPLLLQLSHDTGERVVHKSHGGSELARESERASLIPVGFLCNGDGLEVTTEEHWRAGESLLNFCVGGALAVDPIDECLDVECIVTDNLSDVAGLPLALALYVLPRTTEAGYVWGVMAEADSLSRL